VLLLCTSFASTVIDSLDDDEKPTCIVKTENGDLILLQQELVKAGGFFASALSFIHHSGKECEINVSDYRKESLKKVNHRILSQ
jgi:hypothetical protein